MRNDRRQFLRGAWLRSLEAAPTAEGSHEIANVVVHAPPALMERARASILAVENVEIAAEDPRGKFVVLVEAGPGDRLGETLTALSTAPGVISATLVYHAIDDGKAVQGRRRTMTPRILSAPLGWALAFWRIVARPAVAIPLGVLLLGGFVAGVMFWGVFNTALEAANRESFCVGCHEMQSNVFEELKQTIHYSNRSGVRATCPDCHVPHEWTRKIARKMQASKEVWGHIFGWIDTREKFLDERKTLALHEWARMKANDSLECRNCHSAASMDTTKQSPRAADAHERFLFTGQKTCIDCHKGIAHHLPDMKGVAGWE